MTTPAYYAWQRTLVDSSGVPVASASVEVRDSITAALAQLYSTDTGSTISNPMTATVNGFARFYVAPGVYDIVMTGTALSATWLDVAVGPKATPLFIAPTLLNSWVNYSAGGGGGDWENSGYYKDPFGRVHLRGLVKNGSGLTATILTLPVGYRPSNDLTFATVSNDVFCRMNIMQDGTIAVVSGGSTLYVSLNGLSFAAV